MFTTASAAPTWEDGLITGSGSVGAVVFGPPDRLTVCVAHERFFVPANRRPPAPDLSDALPGLRTALLSGDRDAAADLFAHALADAGFDDLIWTDPLGMCAALTIQSDGGVVDPRRTIDPQRGVVAVHWRDESGAARRVSLVAPRGYDTVWVALEAETPASVRLTLSLAADDAPGASFAPDYTGAVSARGVPGDPGALGVYGSDGRALVTTCASGSWHVVPGDHGALEARALVPSGEPLLLRLDVAVDGRPANPAPDERWDEIMISRTDAHRALVSASSLSLAGAADAETVEAIWDRAREGDEGALRRAVEVAYLVGRAHVIAATGELPPTLQGVWQGTWKPAWSADYTLNGNVQNGALAGAVATGTPELVRSLLDLVLAHLDDYRANARRVFGAEGMLLPSRMSTHGAADHLNSAFPHAFWTGCGGWILRFAADLVATTGDRSLVDDRLWELVTGVLRFGETALVARDGILHIVPGYSPENTPLDAATPLAVDATMDVAILRDAARAAAILADARDDHTLDARWAALAAALPLYRVADDGTLAEWIDPGTPENIAHRHVSQLYPLWYEPDDRFTGDDAEPAALRAAAGETIRRKLAWRAADPAPPPGRGEMAFGLAQLGLAAATLGDAASALACVRTLTLDHWQPSLTTTHDAGRIFNLDASGALPAVVAAMLVGSSVGELAVFPALPDEWSRGSASGLRARGGLVVDLQWDEAGCKITLRMLSQARWLNPTGRVRLRAGASFGGVVRDVVVSDGTTVHLPRRR